MWDSVFRIGELLRFLLRTRFAVACFGLLSLAIGVRFLQHPFGAFAGGIVGSFLVLTGVQILLWLLGIRIELFGTTSDMDPSSSDESVLGARHAHSRHLRLGPDMTDHEAARERFQGDVEMAELETRRVRLRYEFELAELGTQKARLQFEVEIAELQAKLSDLRGRGSSQ